MRENGFRPAAFFLSVLCAVGFALYASESARATAGENALNGVYQRAFYEATETLQSMQVTLKKLSQADSGYLEIEYLSDISRQAASIQENLSALPAWENTVTKTIKFVNQAGDLSNTILKRLASGGAITQADKSNLSVLLETVTELALKMNELSEDLEKRGKMSFASAVRAQEHTSNANTEREYPVLLYDGPFSDSVRMGELKAVTGEAYTTEAAKQRLYDFFGASAKEIRYLGTSRGDMEIHEYSMLLSGMNAYAGVTATGGKILYVLSEYKRVPERLTDEECVKIAVDFLLEKGFGEFTPAYYRKYDGVITVNLAPLENGIILYPDLIKAEVNMENGSVIGLECTNYYTNHVKRGLNPPLLTPGDAKRRLADHFITGEIRLALIPFGNGERLAYEAHTLDGRDEYLIYVDAFTGYEIEIFQVVHSQEGTIVQ